MGRNILRITQCKEDTKTEWSLVPFLGIGIENIFLKWTCVLPNQLLIQVTVLVPGPKQTIGSYCSLGVTAHSYNLAHLP